MGVHKGTRLMPDQRREIYDAYQQGNQKISDLAVTYHVSRPTIYKILYRGRRRDFTVHSSRNKRFACLRYGIKRLSKIEKEIEDRLKKQSKRDNRGYPGQKLYCINKKLDLEGGKSLEPPEYLFMAIDDFSLDLYAAVLPDRTQHSAKVFLEQVLEESPYTVEQFYSNKGKEYRGDPERHEFMSLCLENHIDQCFTGAKTPRADNKAERALKTLLELWHRKTRFFSPADRETELRRFINYYNGVRAHESLGGLTPEEKLIQYFYPDKV